MRYNPLGRSGLLVSELCLGTMTFGGSEGMWGAIGQVQQDEADTIVRAAVDGGINFIDTANVYSAGRSEQILGQALKNLGILRREVVIATKVLGRVGDGPNDAGASRLHVMDQLKLSLDRLGTDYVDLYQIHGWDPVTPLEEQVEALDSVVRAGMVRYIGVSNWAAWQVAKAIGIEERKSLARIVSLQAYYTIAGRDLERDIAPMLKSEGVGLMVWSPLAGGLLSGKYSREDEKSGDGRRASFDFPPVDRDRGYAVIDVMREIAGRKSVSVAQVALAWLLHQEVVTSVIVGAKRVDQLADNLGSVDVTFSPEELQALDQVSALPAEYPRWMIDRQSEYRSVPPRRGG